MLKIGEKGAIPQNDNETYAIAPHIPCGIVTPDLLRKIADVSEKYNAKAIKLTGATRMAITGLDDEQVMTAVDKIIKFYSENAKRGERLGKTIERTGLEPFQEVI